jgi:hypothetical protein
VRSTHSLFSYQQDTSQQISCRIFLKSDESELATNDLSRKLKSSLSF